MSPKILTRSDIDVVLVRPSAGDIGVVEAARVSTIGADSLHEDMEPARVEGLINYLMRDRHGSPFEHNSMTFLITAPIFVLREWHRHRIGWSYNELSGRYQEIDPVFYVPDETRKLVQRGQAGKYEFTYGTMAQHGQTQTCLTASYAHAYGAYEQMLDAGVAREIARAVLPGGIYSTMYATCNARSLMHFLSLRTIDERAAFPSFPQREIEMAAEKMEEAWARLMPVTHAAFNSHGRIAP